MLLISINSDRCDVYYRLVVIDSNKHVDYDKLPRKPRMKQMNWEMTNPPI